MNPGSWRISVDTGGTFTDCYGLPPGAAEEQPILVKLLSSARLEVQVSGISGSHLTLAPPGAWNLPDDFFRGFQASGPGLSPTAVIEWIQADHRLVLETPPSVPLRSITLFTGEEAPVLGARLLTGTALGQAFPPTDFRLGTTRGTNALLERKGTPVAFFVTRGFADLLTIRDQRRPDLFALEHRRPAPLFEAVVEVEERLDAAGQVLEAPDLDRPEFEAEVTELFESGIRIAAVALMHSYRNPAHERALRDRLLDSGFEHVSISSDLAPLIKLLPRAETAVVDAYLTPVMQAFIDHVAKAIGNPRRLLTMTSAGGLEPTASFRPKDSLLSGPAGGVVGAAHAARTLGHQKVITFDMGGTSTDVARIDGDFHYRFEQNVGDARLLSPALKIETVAAGGGSICQWTEAGLRVGPESAGADPGPACYGRGGPLTVTDVNLLLGRIDPENFGIPISEENLAAAREALAALATDVMSKEEDAPLTSTHHSSLTTHHSLLTGLAEIATEQMADAIRTISLREGADPSEYALLAFGGAGPLHACDIAERLGITTILVPREAGLLSAFGIHFATVERFAERQILAPLEAVAKDLPELLRELSGEAFDRLTNDLSCDLTALKIRRQLAEIRLAGQDATLTVEIADPEKIARDFRRKYEDVFGYPPAAGRSIEMVSLRVIAATSSRRSTPLNPVESATQPCSIPPDSFIDRATLYPGARIRGQAIVQDPFSTLFLKENWNATVAANGSLVLEKKVRNDSPGSAPSSPEVSPKGRLLRAPRSSPVVQELFRHRFEQLAGEMGAMLQRSAISTNVKERADFSCALLDAGGELVVNAPHIPVHLGALGLCVREVRKAIALRPGDTIITNHPACGGSHLPDVTLITPVFPKDSDAPIAFVANRAHHAEIGGISPGSMPPAARSLAEEGVVIAPTYLIEQGKAQFDRVEELLTESPFPTRNLADNLADLHAQLAANRRGETLILEMIDANGAETVRHHLEALAHQAQSALQSHLEHSGFTRGEAEERLDDGSLIRCRIERGEKLKIDFSGTSVSHPGNLNATPAIVRSAVLYVLRLWTQRSVPLNEGLLRDVDVVLPRCFLNPVFSPDPTKCPAVVGGNVESSQRIVDTLIRAIGFQACSQGTMNNFIFGDDAFGYYETIGGGSGAGPGYSGTSGLHTHMTNTSITDPEILEHRYPVRLREFSMRRDSGGAGHHQGGDGLVREVEFLRPLQVSLLTQHRIEEPFGLAGGENGTPGRQFLFSPDQPEKEIPGIAAFQASPGEVLRIETPGGGGYGEPTDG